MFNKLIMLTLIIATTITSYAYTVKNVKKNDGYIESIIACENGKRTFVHKTSKGYYSSTYKKFNTFESAVKSSCKDDNALSSKQKKVFRLKHNAKVCKTQAAMERLLDSKKAYHFSVSRDCFTAMNTNKVTTFNKYKVSSLIDTYYKVLYNDEIHYIRKNDMFVQKNLLKKKQLQKKKKAIKKVKNKKKNKNKKSKHKKVSKVKKASAVYHCIARSKSAVGWADSTSKKKAKRIALRQCNIRNTSQILCSIENCYKK